MKKPPVGLFVFLVLFALSITAWILYVNFDDNRVVSVHFLVDKAVDRIDLYQLPDRDNSVATITPHNPSLTNTLQLKVKAAVNYLHDSTTAFYYYVATIGDQQFLSDSFEFRKSKESSTIKINADGSWVKME